MPTGPGWWWRRDYAIPVKVTFAPSGIAPGLWWQRPDARGPSHVTDDGHWLAPVLTPSEATALTERAERAERERDEARHWAEDAAAAENDNAADLRAARAMLEAVRAYVDQLERIGWRDLTEQSPDIAYGMNCAGAQLRIILGGSRE